ncbi:MAG: APC family permease [Acidobacteriaceae bacterium]|nr:APC family permease [Acidobacteriaceae bacterium]
MPRRQLTLLPLIAAIFFMVSGGPYGLEEIIQKAGYSRTILILAIVPFIWSLPVALMVGELSAALPEEGGYYAWVRRALGPFWGFQEAWLSLAASIFDMAIYPTIFLLYLKQLWPAAVAGQRYILVGAAVVAACALWNIAGIKAVGDGSSWMMFLLLAPFAVVAVFCLFRAPSGLSTAPTSTQSVNLLGGIVIAMWNYMGWDNASTVAGEVENPQRNYPLALFGALLLIAACYIIPISALWRTGIDPSGFTTGSWVQVARQIAGPALGWAIVLGGMICGLGMNNALVLSYSRVPYAMANDGMLPAVLTRTNAKGVPWISVIVCATAWTACLPLGFDRLIAMDILIYALSLLLEFGALIALRMREPELERPFRIPGGIAVVAGIALGPLFVLGVAMRENGGERAGPLPTLAWGALLLLTGVFVYPLTSRRKQ